MADERLAVNAVAEIRGVLGADWTLASLCLRISGMGSASDKAGKTDRQATRGSAGKVTLDERGHTVWSGEVQSGHFELVDTRLMEQLLHDDNQHARAEFDRLAAGNEEGIVARETSTGHFRVLETENLDDLMNRPVEGMQSLPAGGRSLDQLEPETGAEDDQELQLVSTQMLRQILGKVEPEAGDADTGATDAPESFNPYDNTPRRR